MSDERVTVSKELLDNIAKPLMLATETTDKLSLSEMATAAQMMLPAKWELVVNTTLEEDVTGIEYTIPNAEEVHIEITNTATFTNTEFSEYVYLWGTFFYTGYKAVANTKVLMAHGKKMGNRVILEYAASDKYNSDILVSGAAAIRNGHYLAKQFVNDNFGMWLYDKDLTILKGATVKIWAKRRVTANE